MRRGRRRARPEARAATWDGSRSADAAPAASPGGLEGGRRLDQHRRRRSTWRTSGARSSCSTSGPSAASTATTSCPTWRSSRRSIKNELVVIGVHTAKFDAEKDTDNIRQKVREYRIKHPVVNDANQVIWNRFGVSSWPTLAVIDANGNLVGAVPGEGNGKQLDKIIAGLIAKHRGQGRAGRDPARPSSPSPSSPHESPLHYPGKVLADPAGKRLFISDTGNNRIVVTDLDGKVLHTIGSGAAGMADGPFDKATFNRPQGMCLLDGTLYVADTENHAIRAVDLKAETVRTVAGTGEQGSHA